MKTNSIPISVVFSFITMIMLAFSCSKETSFEENSINNLLTKEDLINPYDNFGIVHNDVLISWYENNSGLDTNYLKQCAIDYVEEITKSKLGYTDTLNQNWITIAARLYSSDSSLKDYAALFYLHGDINFDQKEKLEDLDDIIMLSETNYTTYLTSMDSFVQSMLTSSMSEDRKQIIYIVAAVAQHSINFWKSAQQDDNHLYSIVFESNGKKSSFTKLLKLAMVDACGAGFGFLVAGPIGAGVGGVVCSGYAAYHLYFND